MADEQSPSEQRGGTTPDDAEARDKGEWAARADEGVVPADLGGSDAPREMLDEDPELGSDVLGRTTGSSEPATEEGVDLSAGDSADAVTDGGPELPEDAEPDLKDAMGATSGRTPTQTASAARRLGSCTSVAETLTVRQTPQRTRTLNVICSSCIDSARTLPHCTQT